MKKLYTWIIYVLLFIPPLVFFTNLTRNPYCFQIFLLNAVVLFFWIVFLLQTISTGKLKWSASPVDLPLVCFICIAVISWLYTYVSVHGEGYPQKEIISAGKQIIGTNLLSSSVFSEGIKRIIFLLVNVLLSYWISLQFMNEKNFTKIFHLLFTVGLIAAVYAILQYSGIELIWPKKLNPFSGRPVSTFGNPNFMSSYLVLLLPVIGAYYISKISSARKLGYLSVIIIYFVSLLCTLTRSSWIGLFVSFLFIMWYLYRQRITDGKKSIFYREKKWLYTLVILGILSFLLLPKNKFGSPSTISRLTEITSVTKGAYSPVHQRLMIWSCGWEMAVSSPLLGRGWGLFELFYPFHQGKYMFNKIYRIMRTHANNAHNEILEIWSQTGIIGLGTYLWFICCVFIYGLRITDKLPDEKKIFSIAILAGLIGMFVDNIFGNVSMQFCVPAFLYWWNIGALAGFDATKKTYELRVTGLVKLILLLLIIIFCYLIHDAYNRFMGEVNYFSGFKYSKQNDTSRALPYLEKAHKYNREVNSEYELANCYARTKQESKAVFSYYHALSANCGYDEIYFNLATIYSQKNDIENAAANYTQALYINPTSQDSYRALGNIFLNNLDQYKNSAVELFKQGVYFYPENIDLWNNLGYLYTKKGDDEKAVESYRKALEIDPEFDLARHNLQSLLKKLGREDEFIPTYDLLIKQAEEEINKKNYEEVIRICRQIVKIAPNSSKGRFYLANSLFSSGQIDDAIEEYNKAISIEPRNIYAHCNLGLAYMRKNQFQLAKKSFEATLQIDPQNKTARENIERINSLR